MLFLIGLEMEPHALWEMRERLIGWAGCRSRSLGAVAAVCLALGRPWNQALAVGMILCLSSTAIVMQSLSEKRLGGTEGGRASFAVLLFQDVAAIPFLALLPLLAYGGAVPAEEGDLEMLEGVPGGQGADGGGRGGAGDPRRAVPDPAAVPLHRLGRPARDLRGGGALVRGRDPLGMSMLGLSPALGSFLAGVVLANSEYRHELEADLAPFKGLLLGLFFLAVGARLDLQLLGAEPAGILGLTLAFMALKLGILYLLARAFGLPRRARVLFTLALAQAASSASSCWPSRTRSTCCPGRGPTGSCSSSRSR